MINEKDLYKRASYVARRFHKFYGRKYFSLSSIDLKDLIQESQIACLSTITKYKNENKTQEDMIKLVNLRVGWHLQKMLYNEKQRLKINTKENVELEEYKQEGEEENNFQFVDDSYLGDKNANMTCLNKGIKPFVWEDLKLMVNTIEYMVLTKFYKEDKSLLDIGKELNYSIYNIKKIMNGAIKKLREIEKK